PFGSMGTWLKTTRKAKRKARRKVPMKRRDVLKALAAVPVAGALGCRHDNHDGKYPAVPDFKTRTVQILLEGAFSLVLHKDNPNRLTAFVLKEEAGHEEIAHDFFFNDPSLAKPRVEKDAAGYHFDLAADGLRNYADTYINPGFNDFLGDTEKWFLRDRIVTITLPFPGSINFGGRPLNVTFASGRKGVMPTNFILEYYAEEPKKISMSCPRMGGHCQPTPHCPPGVARFFFSVVFRVKDPGKQQQHAVDFFNFTLERSFPELAEKFRLAAIDPSEELRPPGYPGAQRPTSMRLAPEGVLRPAVLSPAERPARLLRVSETVDCQVGGMLVRTNSPAGP